MPGEDRMRDTEKHTVRHRYLKFYKIIAEQSLNKIGILSGLCGKPQELTNEAEFGKVGTLKTTMHSGLGNKKVDDF